MEPMTLGSPVGSPVQSPGSPGATSTYLPSFLLGDTHIPTKVSMMSPLDSPRHLHMGHSNLTSPTSQHGTPDYRINRQKAVFGAATTPNTSQIVTESHTGGPPTRSLFDTLDTSQAMSQYNSATSQNVVSPLANHSRLPMSTMFAQSPLNPNTNESQGLLQWVTVFGFPQSALNAVLSHISSRVRIVDKHPAPHPQCNWIHLKCASEQEAERALACNGNVVSCNIMIGVNPCTDEGVILTADKENRAKLNGSVRSLTNISRLNRSPECISPRTPVRIQNARHLAAGYNQHMSPQSVKSPENVPQKSTGIVSRAMEYVFGW